MAKSDISLLEIDVVEEYDEDQVLPPPSSNTREVWEIATRLVGKSLQTAEDAVARRSADLVAFDQKLEALQGSKSKAAQTTLPRLKSRRLELEEEIQTLRTHLSDFLFLSDAMGQLHREALLREELQEEALIQIKKMTVDTANAKAEAAAIRRAADKAGKKNAQLHDQLHQLERGNAHLQGLITDLERQVRTAKESAGEEKVKAIAAKLEAAEKRVRSLEAENAAFRASIEDTVPLKAEVEKLRSTVSALGPHKAEAEHLKAENAALRSRLAEKDAAVAELQALVDVLSGGDGTANLAPVDDDDDLMVDEVLPPRTEVRDIPSSEDADLTMTSLRAMPDTPPPATDEAPPVSGLPNVDDLFDDIAVDEEPPPAPPVHQRASAREAAGPEESGPIPLPGNANVEVDLDFEDLVLEEEAEGPEAYDSTETFNVSDLNTMELDELVALDESGAAIDEAAVVRATDKLVDYRAQNRVEVKVSGILLHQAYTLEEILKLAQLDEGEVRRTLRRYVDMGLATVAES